MTAKMNPIKFFDKIESSLNSTMKIEKVQKMPLGFSIFYLLSLLLFSDY
jgi:hypothetical protein